MSEVKKPSVEEILAACRKADAGRKQGASGGRSDVAPPSAEASAAAAGSPAAASPMEQQGSQQVSTSPTPASAAAASSRPQGRGAMSTEEILAAARRKPGTSGQSAAEAPAGASGQQAPSATKPAAKMSVAEVLAAARAKGKPAATAAPASPAALTHPTSASSGAAEAQTVPAERKAPPAEKKISIPVDTASVLVGAPAVKPGPMSKAEAEARGKPTPVAPAKPSPPPMPQRPPYLERAQPARTTPTTSRRSFFGAMVGVLFGSSLAVGFSSLFVTNLLWLLGLARFMFPNILTEPPTVFKVGFPDSYAPGQVETRYVSQFGVWIVRYEYQGQPQIFALRTVCTHLGCTPNWLEAEQKFKCPCHGSGFYKDGINFEGPAPRPLERYAIRISDDGQLEVDKSRLFREELGQWKDPASYVPV
jgi:cytochrome b6-f complex iron-sulfur subunit